MMRIWEGEEGTWGSDTKRTMRLWLRRDFFFKEIRFLKWAACFEAGVCSSEEWQLRSDPICILRRAPLWLLNGGWIWAGQDLTFIFNIHTQFCCWKYDRWVLQCLPEHQVVWGNHNMNLEVQESHSAFLQVQSTISKWFMEVLMYSST